MAVGAGVATRCSPAGVGVRGIVAETLELDPQPKAIAATIARPATRHRPGTENVTLFMR